MIHPVTAAVIALHRRLGDARLQRLLGRYSIGEAHTALSDLLEGASTRESSETQRLADKLAEMGCTIVTVLDAEYPGCLRALADDAPPLLYVTGDLAATRERSVAIIGTRRPCAAGRAAARLVARAAAERQWTVVSGNAPGIDATAHHECLTAGGTTIVYPPMCMAEYTPEFRARAPERTTVITPFAPGTTVAPWMFLRRNTLVAAQCRVACAAETGSRGGTLDTVKKLLKMQREVYLTALPESARFYRAHQMLAATPGVHLLPALDDDAMLLQELFNAGERCPRESASVPVLDDLFAGEAW